MTVNDHVVRYQEHVSTKSYEELVAAFEETGPDAGSGEPTRTLGRVRDSENSRAAWEAAVAPLFGPSGFTRVFSLDTGRIISWYGKPAKGPQIGRSADSTSADWSSGTLRLHRYAEPPPSSAVRCCGRSSVTTSATEARNQSCLRSSTCRFRLRLLPNGRLRGFLTPATSASWVQLGRDTRRSRRASSSSSSTTTSIGWPGAHNIVTR